MQNTAMWKILKVCCSKTLYFLYINPHLRFKSRASPHHASVDVATAPGSITFKSSYSLPLCGRTAKYLKIGRLKSVLPENLLIRQLSDLAFGSRFVYNCPSACFSEINIVPRTAPSTQCQQKKVTSIHMLGRSLIQMKCLAAFHAKPQATPYRQ